MKLLKEIGYWRQIKHKAASMDDNGTGASIQDFNNAIHHMAERFGCKLYLVLVNGVFGKKLFLIIQ